jgi:hypothetical protein
MNIISKKIDVHIGHMNYLMIENDPLYPTTFPPEVLAHVTISTSPTWLILPIAYQLATQANSVIELGVGYGKATECILFGLRDGKKGHLYSIDLGHEKSRDVQKRILKRSDIKDLWSIMWHDAFLVPDNLLKLMQVDFIFSDIEIRQRPPEIYECIYPTEPRIDRSIPRTHLDLINKYDKALKVGGFIVMRFYESLKDIRPLIDEKRYEVVYCERPISEGTTETFQCAIFRKLKSLK